MLRRRRMRPRRRDGIVRSMVPARPDHDVAYLTDVEGSWTRLASFCAASPLVTLDGDVLRVQDGATFVFGGDAIDRGPWSRRIVRTLQAAKQAQPDQVVLLGGNRDLNKLRLPRELGGFPPRRAPDDAKTWPRARLLQFIFAKTMGAGDAFAHRRTELAYERGVDAAAVEDEDVAQSFVDDLAPDGALTRYLASCQLAWRAGATLYVHGGVAEEALSIVPGLAPVDLARFDDEEWLARLDAFYTTQIQAFRARALRPDGSPLWEDAVLYQAPRPGAHGNPGSVVYGRMGDALNNPGLPAPEVVAALQRCGVRRVVVGHTPSGDTPSIVRATATKEPFEVVVADNSRSRVDTASVTTIRDDGLRIDGRCVLEDGRAIDVALELPIDDRTTPIGRRVAGAPDLVKARHDDGWLLFRYEPEWRFVQRLVPELGPLD